MIIYVFCLRMEIQYARQPQIALVILSLWETYICLNKMRLLRRVLRCILVSEYSYPEAQETGLQIYFKTELISQDSLK